MHEVIPLETFQYVMSSKEAKRVGKDGLAIQTNQMLSDFYDKLAKIVLNPANEDDHFVIQLGFGKLDAQEVEKIECH